MTGKNKTTSWLLCPPGLSCFKVLVAHTPLSIWPLKSVCELLLPFYRWEKTGPRALLDELSKVTKLICSRNKSWTRSPGVFPVTIKSLLPFINLLQWSQTLTMISGTVSHVILTTLLWSRLSYLHFADEETAFFSVLVPSKAIFRAGGEWVGKTQLLLSLAHNNVVAMHSQVKDK